MHIYDLYDKQGRAFAFEIDNLVISRGAVAEVVRSIAGARVLHQSHSWWGPDVFCEFEIGGMQFQAWEPWGDNSRYWIGPKPPEFCEQTAIVRAAFAAYSPRPLRSASVTVKLALILGGLLLAEVQNWKGETRLALAIAGAVAVGVALWAIDSARRRKERTARSAPPAPPASPA